MTQTHQKRVVKTGKTVLCVALVFLSLLFAVSWWTAFSGEAASVGIEPAADGWSMFHHDLLHTGSSDSLAPVTNQTAWRYNTGGPVGSPVVAGGVVYVGSYDDSFYALNASSGAVVWSFETGGNVVPSAAVAEDRVYFGSEGFGRDDGDVR